jgi:2-polyprenyl-3-methyl-5-hydroxy-6-metoxy-1,4-benzoquinol methylase
VHFQVRVDWDDQVDHFTQVRMASYSRSVQVVRERSYRTLVEAVRAYVREGQWLDVGCSFGWLLQYVQTRGFDPYGVEPSPSAAQDARDRGLHVAVGEYPDVGGKAAPYQVISLIDVLEHIANPFLVLRAARRHLTPGGILVIQVPDRECLLYSTALLLSWIGGERLGGPLRRLYLQGLDFPHLFYYHDHSLKMVLEREGFQVLRRYRASIGSLDTALERVAYLEGPRKGAMVNWTLALGVCLLQVLDNMFQHGGLLVTISRKL